MALTERDHQHMQNESILRKQIEEWVADYKRDEQPHPIGQSAAILALDVFLVQLRFQLPGLDLKQAMADVQRAIEILQAFRGKLSILDVQLNGVPDDAD